jgi:hypothetical protein
VWKTGLPVRSAVLKPHAGELVVGWVTTSESSLLYVFVHPFFWIRWEILSCRPILQPVQPIHLNALNATILHLNILHAPESLTCPSPPILIFSHSALLQSQLFGLVLATFFLGTFLTNNWKLKRSIYKFNVLSFFL